MTQSVNSLCREVTKWSVASDHRLTRIFAYLKGTYTFGVLWRVAESHTLDKTGVIEYGDSDHGGDISMRSTSGWLTYYGSEDHVSSCLIDWNSKRQGATERGSAGAEAASAGDAIQRSGLPLLELLSIFQGSGDDEEQEPFFEHLIDADAARLVISGQKGTMLAHMRKHQKLNLAFLRDVFAPANRSLRRIDTTENPADALTKAMKDHAGFLKHRTAMGVVDTRAYESLIVREDKIPERPQQSLARRALGGVSSAASAMSRAILDDPETRSRLTRWCLNKTLGA
jgi:hypothetical protein